MLYVFYHNFLEREKNQEGSRGGKKGKNKITSICRWHECLWKNAKECTKKLYHLINELARRKCLFCALVPHFHTFVLFVDDFTI